tara:strand:+ start:3694 stop:4101 length:408 start_codon:yes stop_codon:yes gene_type:complete
MAFGARRVYPNDTRPRVAIGVNLPFSEPGVFQSNYQTRDAIKNNLINYFLTNPGERPGNPTFGAGLRKFIFSSITNENFEFIKEDLQEKVNIFFSNINLEDIEISKNVNANTINVSIKYSIPQTGINDELLLNFS